MSQRRARIGTPGVGRCCLGLAALLLLSCAPRTERLPSPEASGGSLLCSRFNPVMQTAILEAVVAGGGPNSVEVAGWMCGRTSSGSVRIVMLRYTPDDPSDTLEHHRTVRAVKCDRRTFRYYGRSVGRAPKPVAEKDVVTKDKADRISADK